MPQRKQPGRKGLVHVLFLAAALSLLSAVVRRERSRLVMTTRARSKKVRVGPRRIAASIAFTTLFFAGAALSAGAGDTVSELLDQGTESALSSTTTDTTAGPALAPAEAPPVEEPAATPEPAPAEEPAPDAQVAEAPASEPDSAADQSTAKAPAHGAQQPAPSLTQNAGVQSALSQRAKKTGLAGAAEKAPQEAAKAHGKPGNQFDRQPPVVKSDQRLLRAPLDREAEADEPNVAATVWLYRSLPDPTPPSRRLKPAFARQLARISARNNVDWALTLAVLRASGERGAMPASKARLQFLTKKLRSLHSKRSAWSSVLALEGRTTFADRTIALQNLYRAVGLEALVKGFDWAKPSLSKRILNDRRVSIYAGGRSDIQAGRVNIRVLTLIAYLAEAHGQATVSSLISGHRLYSRPGVISAHIYGLAADISVVGNASIMGNSRPGGVTEKAVRNILLLPAEMQPRQVISLLGLGGPSFPLSNHDDHIHVGF
jgi:hypothetical protein